MRNRVTEEEWSATITDLEGLIELRDGDDLQNLRGLRFDFTDNKNCDVRLAEVGDLISYGRCAKIKAIEISAGVVTGRGVTDMMCKMSCDKKPTYLKLSFNFDLLDYDVANRLAGYMQSDLSTIVSYRKRTKSCKDAAATINHCSERNRLISQYPHLAPLIIEASAKLGHYCTYGANRPLSEQLSTDSPLMRTARLLDYAKMSPDLREFLQPLRNNVSEQSVSLTSV